MLFAIFLRRQRNLTPTIAGIQTRAAGFPLGFSASAIFSGFGSYLAELYPSHLRGTGQGFTYNFGRGVGALFPAGIGFAAQSMGVGGAVIFAAAAYGIAVLALLGLPETVGRELG